MCRVIPRCRCFAVICCHTHQPSPRLPTFNLKRTMIMFKLFTMGLVAATLSLGTADSAQAGCRNRCGMSQACAPACSAPSCSAPMATPAPAAEGHMDHAVAAPPANAQANSGTYRSFSFEPSVQSNDSVYGGSRPVYRARSSNQTGRSQTPRFLIPKADPRKYN